MSHCKPSEASLRPLALRLLHSGLGEEIKSPEIVAALRADVLYGLELLTCLALVGGLRSHQHLALAVSHEKGVKSQTKMIQLVQISLKKSSLFSS